MFEEFVGEIKDVGGWEERVGMGMKVELMW